MEINAKARLAAAPEKEDKWGKLLSPLSRFYPLVMREAIPEVKDGKFQTPITDKVILYIHKVFAQLKKDYVALSETKSLPDVQPLMKNCYLAIKQEPTTFKVRYLTKLIIVMLRTQGFNPSEAKNWAKVFVKLGWELPRTAKKFSKGGLYGLLLLKSLASLKEVKKDKD